MKTRKERLHWLQISTAKASNTRPSVKLPQGEFLGIQMEDGFPHPLDAFLGIPYAMPATGENCFKPAQKIEESRGIIDGSKYGHAAPGKALLSGGPNLEQSEDCLTANIFLPTRFNGLLPVAIYLHGSAFNRGSAAMHDTASMIAWSGKPFIGVSSGYRIGALGFLPSKVSKDEGILNLGLRDQVLLFEWVRDNIGRFGGDPGNVTLMGLSAGAHSIGHHMLNHDHRKLHLFHRAIMESGSPTSRAVRPYDAKIHEEQFQDFLRELKCPEDLDETEIFSYLRSLASSDIIEAQTTVFDKYNPSLRWSFQPVIDGDIIALKPLEAWHSQSWNRIPIMTGFNTNEANAYVNKQMSEPSEFCTFWQNLLPNLSASELDTVEQLYPDPKIDPRSPYKETGEGLGAQFRRIEAAYGHYAYVAPVRQTAHLASSQGGLVCLYHWALPRTILGASHADNMYYETYNNDVREISESQNELLGTLHAYLTSFITTGDPNTVRGRYPHRPEWSPFEPTEKKIMLFGKDNQELIGGEVAPPAKIVVDDWARKETEFWWSKTDLSEQA